MRKQAIGLAIASIALAGAAAAETISYRYDARGRLVQVERNRAGAAPVVTRHEYDKANNRTGKIVTGVP